MGLQRGRTRSQQWFASCSGLGLVKRAVWLLVGLHPGSILCVAHLCPFLSFTCCFRSQAFSCLAGWMLQAVCVPALGPGRCRRLARLLWSGRAKPGGSRHVPKDVAPHPETRRDLYPSISCFFVWPEQNVIQHIVHRDVMNLQSQELQLH